MDESNSDTLEDEWPPVKKMSGIRKILRGHCDKKGKARLSTGKQIGMFENCEKSLAGKQRAGVREKQTK